jgi:hypothetical protein
MGSEATRRQCDRMTDDVPWQAPEDRELKRKQGELSSLVRKVTFMESELVTIQCELSAFEFKYHRIVGLRYTELDLLEAHLSAAKETLNPAGGDRAAEPVAQAFDQRSLERFLFPTGKGPAERIKPNEPLKKLYREVAKRIHPDLGLDEKDRLKRQILMAEANEAYRSGDGRKLRAILFHWHASPERVVGEGPGVDLVRVIRRVDQVRRRIRFLSGKMEALKRSELYRLKTLIEENERAGRDLLCQMAAILDGQIARTRALLRGLTPRQADG